MLIDIWISLISGVALVVALHGRLYKLSRFQRISDFVWACSFAWVIFLFLLLLELLFLIAYFCLTVLICYDANHPGGKSSYAEDKATINCIERNMVKLFG